MSYVTAIVLAAGQGKRLPAKISKLLFEINSRPIIIYSLNTLSKHPGVREIILVVNSRNQREIVAKLRKYRIEKIKQVVLGGRLRQHSVIKGLGALNSKTDLVLIHDGARPFIDRAMVSSSIQTAKRYGAAIVGVPMKCAIKEVVRRPSPSGRLRFASHSSVVRQQIFVRRTLDREGLWEIQTPQVFKKELILEAYKRFAHIEVTDDAALVEKLGAKVRLVMGAYSNIKITTPEDLALAQAILRAKKNFDT